MTTIQKRPVIVLNRLPAPSGLEIKTVESWINDVSTEKWVGNRSFVIPKMFKKYNVNNRLDVLELFLRYGFVIAGEP